MGTTISNIQERRYLLITVLLASVSGSLMLSGVTVALPTIGKELSMNAIDLSWITQSFNLALVVCTLPLARLADITGRKRMYTSGILLFVVATLVSGLTGSSLMLILLRVVQGISMAMVWGTASALLSAAYPYNERGRVLGWLAAAVYLGMSLGPTIGGLLTQYLGWRSIFYFGVIIQIPVLALLFTRVKGEWAEAEGEKFDIIGSILFGIALFFIVYGFSSITTINGISCIAIGIVVLVAFIVWELRVESPTLDIRLCVRNRLFAFSGLSQLLFQVSVFPVSFILSLYLQYVRGLSPQDAGFVLLAQPVIQAVFSPLAGRLSDRIQPRILASGGVVITTVGILLLLTATGGTDLLPIIVSQALIGLGISFFASPNTNAIMSSVEKKYYGVAAAVQSTSRDIGIAFGMGVLMLLLSLNLGTAQITPEYHAAFVESIRVTLIFFAAASFCCFFVSASRGKIVPPSL